MDRPISLCVPEHPQFNSPQDSDDTWGNLALLLLCSPYLLVDVKRVCEK